MNKIKRQIDLHLMIIPGIILVFIFSYIPIFGNVIAFKDYTPLFGFENSPWVGFDNYRYVFGLQNFWQVIWNTVYIAVMKIILELLIPIILSLLMNEARGKLYKNSIQTAMYIPHFMSWVLLGGIFMEILALNGPVNNVINFFGLDSIYFLGDNAWFPIAMVMTDTWKEMGFNTIVFMAAITSIDPQLYEAAMIDRAGRWRQTLHVTIPGMLPIIILMGALSLGNVLNAGFDQIFTLYSPQVYQSGDIIDTLTYRIGLVNAQFGPATAIGMFKSLVSCVLVSLSYFLASKFANYRIF